MAAFAAAADERRDQRRRRRRCPSSSSSSSPLLPSSALLLLLLFLVAAAATTGLARAANEQGSTQAHLDAVLKKYMTNAELAAWADDFVSRCGSVARKYTIGKSATGKHDLIVLEISDKPGVKEPEPSFQYVANMHGNEPSGRALLPALAEYLCANSGGSGAAAADPQAARLVKEAHVHMLLTMNPDGYETRRRENANYADLNRDFPDAVARGVALDGPSPGDGAVFSSPSKPGGKFDFASAAAAVRTPGGSEQPETLAVMKWMLSPPQGAPFAAGANLHEGAIVANYPWDGYADGSEANRGVVRPAPENAAFVRMAKAYASAHTFMSKSREFKDGIVNGAQWYPVYGGLQDWGYVAAGTLGITLELSQRKMRPDSDLPSLWRENRAALVALPAAAVLGGARGRVWARAGGGKKEPLRGAALAFDGVNRTTAADSAFAFFARPLAPGRHVVRVTAPGYASLEQTFDVPKDGAGSWLDLVMEPLSSAAAGAAGGAAGGTGEGGSDKAAGSGSSSGSESTTATLRAGGGRRPNSSEPAPWRLQARGGGQEGEGADDGSAAAPAPGAAAVGEEEAEGAGAAAARVPVGSAGARSASAGALVVLAQAGMIVAVAGAVAVQRRKGAAAAAFGGGGGGAGGGGSGSVVGLASVGAFRPSRQPPLWRPVSVREDAAV